MAKKSKSETSNEEENMSQKSKSEEIKDAVFQFDDADFNVEHNTDALIWDPETGPLFFTPLNARLVDSSIDKKNKFSCLVLGRLEAPHPFKDKDGNDVTGEVGASVGVWIAGHLHKLIKLAGNIVRVEATGETRDVGKGNEMLVYSVRTKKDARTRMVELEGDFRDSSRSLDTPWTRQGLAVSSLGGKEEIPF